MVMIELYHIVDADGQNAALAAAMNQTVRYILFNFEMETARESILLSNKNG